MEFKEKSELCIHLLDSETDYIKIMSHVNKPLQQKYGRQRKLNYRYTSIPSAFSFAKKLNLLLKHRNCGHVTGRSGVEYSVSGQSCAVV